MLFFCSAFDFSKNPPQPLLSCLFDDEVRKPELLDVYGGKGLLRSASTNKQKICDLVKDREVVILDCKAHFDSFDLLPKECWEASPTMHVQGRNLSSLELKKTLLKCMSVITKMNGGPAFWRKTVADAAVIYAKLQKRRLTSNGAFVHPIYHLDTFSGRSRVTGFPLQSVGAEANLAPESDFDYFLHFDWLSADMRMAAVLSEDEDLAASFLNSDPYTNLSKMLQLPRDECKISLLAAIYSLSLDAPILSCHPKFKQWMAETVEKIQSDGYADSVLGRRFHVVEGGSDDRTVFNAVIQGSVAHAMHLVLKKVFASRAANVFTELQDAPVLTVRRDEVGEVVEEVVEAMLHPFEGVLDGEHVFPVRVSIGKHWRKWRRFKTFR